MSHFPEEPLDLSTKQGFGYFASYPGYLLKQGRYKIIRKLGFGPRSSVWLVVDLEDSREDQGFWALKVLTTHATAQKSQELQSLEKIRRMDLWDLPSLRDHFIEEGNHGDHQCFVLNPLGPDLDTFRQTSPTKSLRLHTVKKVIASVLEPLDELENRVEVIYGALKADNLLFSVSDRAIDVRPILDAPLPSIVQKEVNGTTYPIVLSEPLSQGSRWDDDVTSVANYDIYLSNVGHAQAKRKDPSWDTSVDPSLRPPEVILGTEFDNKADIWMLGCTASTCISLRSLFLTSLQIYHLLTGKPLFPEGLDDVAHLARMLAIVGDFFSTTMAQKSKRRDEFFNVNGFFEHPIPDTSLEAELAEKGIPEKDIPGVVEFIQECLSLHPEDRPSASDLMDHAWVQSGFACSCGYSTCVSDG